MIIKCLNCRKEIKEEINLNNNSSWLPAFCSECAKNYKNSGTKRCDDCDEELEYIMHKGEKFETSRTICVECECKRVEKARNEGNCIQCFYRPQSNRLDNSGKKTELCEECGIALTDSIERRKLNTFRTDLNMFKKAYPNKNKESAE